MQQDVLIIYYLLFTHGVTTQIQEEQLSLLLNFKLKLVPMNVLFLLFPLTSLDAADYTVIINITPEIPSVE